MAKVEISEGSPAETAEFFAEQWRPWDDAVGVHWDGGEQHLAARIGDELVGAAYYAVAGGVGELKQILVVKDRAGAGIGSLLLDEFERRCRACGCHKLRLETAEYQARGFYEKHGFEAVHTFEDDRFHKRWYLMEKRTA